MLSSLARTTHRLATTKLPTAAAFGPAHTPATRAAVARYASRFLSSMTPYAVDGPDGDHDLEDVEEHMEGVNRIIDFAAVTEDADSITKMHEAVLGTTLFAVDAPDGEHDLEDVEEHMTGVDRIIDEASALEDPLEVKQEQHLQEEIRKKSADLEFENSKY
mmetsp:Transcript_15928/g.26897  ORF Transcript_15928/g.26897 Transcript_15928/m.26897 type:complete len:161 (-) Transcript_15928:144-626(-)